MRSKIVRALLSLAFALVLLSSFNICFALEGQQFYPMETERFDTDIVVSENNSYRVTETIEVNFNYERHGIYRYIPNTFKVTRNIDGKEQTSSCRIRISDVKVEGEELDVYIEDSCTVIQIGSADRYVKGKHTYKISYKVENRDDGIAEFDEFYWNVLPHDWESPIENSKVTITFPKQTDLWSAEIISGEYGEVKADDFSLEVGSEKITAELKAPLKRGEGATVNVKLPNEYFVGEEENPTLMFVMALVITLAFAAVVVLKIVFGRNRQVVPVVSFYPPEDMTSADVGYALDGLTDQKDIISLIIFWANKGLLSIKEEAGGVMRLTKLRELDKGSKYYEKELFEELFKGRDTVTTEELKEKFYTAVTNAQLNVKYSFKEGKPIFKTSSIVAGVFAVVLTALPFAALLFIGSLIKIVSEWVLVGAAILSAVLLGLLAILTVITHKKNALSSSAYKASKIAAWIAVLAVAAISAFIGTSALGYHSISVAAFFITVACAFMSTKMRCLTAYGAKITGELLGFKEFIIAAELDKLNALVETDPQYFYNVLPYAYVFGLTDKWAEKFEGIAVEPPSWYQARAMGRINMMLFVNSFDRTMNTIKINMTSVPARTSGGFSAGGGFSGGGGGGGGGGSW